jgi:hypothetical protein
MPDDAQKTAQKQVTLIRTDRVRILNPRFRNRRTFEEIVENIAKIGLKRPITVRIAPEPTLPNMPSFVAKGGSRRSWCFSRMPFRRSSSTPMKAAV